MLQIIYLTTDTTKIVTSSIVLTKRESEILQNYINGLSGPEIARKLGVSYSCIKRHKENMLHRNSCMTVLDLIIKLCKEI